MNIFLKKENINTLSQDASTKLLLSVLSSVNELEVSTLKARMGRGMMSAVLKGKMMHSVPPYGYIRDENKMWSINEKETKAIRIMFDLALKGTTLYGIAQHLNSLNIPTRSTIQGKKSKLYNGKEVDIKWKPFMVRRILKKTIYKGEKNFKGNIITIPAIVSPDLWKMVQKRFEDKVGYINKNRHDYLFKGMIRCGFCGRIFGTQTRNNKTGYYLCTTMTQPTDICGNIGLINTPLIDNNLYNILFNHKYIEQILTQDTKRDIEKDEKEKQIGYYYSEIESLEGQIGRVKKLYQTELYSFEEMTKELNMITNNIKGIKNNISLLENELNAISEIDINKLIVKYQNAEDFNTKREFVTKYINAITLYMVNIANVKWDHPLQKNEKMIYIEIYAFHYNMPMKVLITPYSKNVMVSNNFQFLKDYNTVVDITLKHQMIQDKLK